MFSKDWEENDDVHRYILGKKSTKMGQAHFADVAEILTGRFLFISKGTSMKICNSPR